MRKRTVLLAALLGLFALAVPAARAGGWATATLDSLPKEVRAGQKITLGFVVRQHGQTPVNDFGGQTLKPFLVATHAESKQEVRADAVQSGAVGHFVVDVTFPTAGAWTFKVVPHPFPDPTEIGLGGEDAAIPLTVLPPLAGEPTGEKDALAVANSAAVVPANQSNAGLWWATGGILSVAVALSVLIMRGGLRRKVAG